MARPINLRTDIVGIISDSIWHIRAINLVWVSRRVRVESGELLDQGGVEPQTHIVGICAALYAGNRDRHRHGTHQSGGGWCSGGRGGGGLSGSDVGAELTQLVLQQGVGQIGTLLLRGVQIAILARVSLLMVAKLRELCLWRNFDL